MKSKRVSSKPKDCLRHSLMRRSYWPVEAISSASCEKVAILMGLGSFRSQISSFSPAVWYSFNEDDPINNSSAEPHESVNVVFSWAGSCNDDWKDHCRRGQNFARR